MKWFAYHYNDILPNSASTNLPFDNRSESVVRALPLSDADKLVSPQRHVLKNGWRGTLTSLAICCS